jgi:hypothetical protein
MTATQVYDTAEKA